MRNTFRWTSWSALSLAVALLAACNDQSKTTAPTPDTTKTSQPAAQPTQPAPTAATPKTDDTRDEKPGPHGRMHRGHDGAGMLIQAALHELELTPEQKTTIEGALAKAEPKDQPPPAHNALASLAEGVRAGKVDPAAVTVPARDAAADARMAASVEALQTLHKTLTKEQRRALVDKLQKHADEHAFHAGPDGKGLPPGAKGAPPGGPGADAKAPPPGADAKAPPAAAPNGGKGAPPAEGKASPAGADLKALGPMGFMLHDLDLTDKQRDDIKKALEAQKSASPPDHEAMKKHFEAMHAAMKARLETFASDSFDAKAFLAPPEGSEAAGKQMLEQMAKSLAVIVPILEPAQREKLAARLEKGPGMMGRGPGAPAAH